MMFKRPHLRPTRHLVNVGLAASLIFICACSNDQPSNEAPRAGTEAVETVGETQSPSKLQAVWSTNMLSAEITDVAVSGGPNPLLAATLAGGQIQLFDLDGERLTEPKKVGVQRLSDGAPAKLGEVQVTLFPGINTSGRLSIYLYNRQLGSPVAIDLPDEINAAGLCSGASLEEDALLSIGYWTKSAVQELVTVDLYETNGEFVLEDVSVSEHDIKLGGCVLAAGSDSVRARATGTADLAQIGKADTTKVLQLGSDGQLQQVNPDGSTETVPIRAGLSVGVPSPITAFTSLPDAQFGGYPNGVIIVAGAVGGDQKLVFVEPIGLFDD